MNLFERAKAIMFKPGETWEIIKGEQTTVWELFTSYAAILAAVPPVANFIGESLVGRNLPFVGYWRQPVLSGIYHLVLQYALFLASLFVAAFVADFLAPSFDSKKNLAGAMKALVFSSTTYLLAGVLFIVPFFWFDLIVFLAALYSFYLLYLGLPVMMETPREKRPVYFMIVVVVTAFVTAIAHFIAAMVLIKATMVVP